MNLFTKIDRFLRPSKYKEDRITKPLELIKNDDYIFVLILGKNPFEFNVRTDDMFYIDNVMYGAIVLKMQVIERGDFLDTEYWKLWSEETFHYGERIWTIHQLEVSFDNETKRKRMALNHTIVKQDGLYVFISTDKKYLAKTIRQIEKNVALINAYAKDWKNIGRNYQQLVKLKKQLSSLRFKLMRI